MEFLKSNPEMQKYLTIVTVTGGALGVIYLSRGVFLSLRQRWLARVSSAPGHSHAHSHGHSHTHGGSGGDAERHAQLKATLFHQLKGQVSKAKNLKREDGIRILEIGVGSGTNFQYYPSPCVFIAVDPNPYFAEDVDANLKKHPQIKLERRVYAGAEDMSQVPNSSVDAVVATFVFCQVKDVHQVFKEIKRILVPGGKFFYMDHLASHPWTLRRLLEIFMTYTGLARLIFNASLTRDIGKSIQSAGFAHVHQEYVKLAHNSNVCGIAEK